MRTMLEDTLGGLTLAGVVFVLLWALIQLMKAVC